MLVLFNGLVESPHGKKQPPSPGSRCSRWSRSALQEERGVLAEQRVVLEQEPVSGVWIEDELGVGQAPRQDKRVHSRDDQVMAAARDQDRVRNFAQTRVGRVLVAIPAGQGCALRLYPRSHQAGQLRR
jgi:hypothetical protein